MKSADLPKEKASEPNEEARQPSPQLAMPGGQNQKKLTFAANVEVTSSQKSRSYKDVLSQPPAEMSHSQKLLWLQERRTAGLWAQCDDCDRWRYLNNVLDRHELPNKWFCWMNPDKEFASCSVPEAPLSVHDEEDLIHSEYAAGSLVWARLPGWPWWPAMVDDCPDTEQYYWLDAFSDIPTHYNVVFFDNMEVTRNWIAPEQLMPFSSNKDMIKRLLKNKKYYSRLKAAMAQANEAEKLPLEIRLARFSFVARYKGPIKSPKKVKRADIEKYQRLLKRKYNIAIPLECSESDEDIMVNNKNEEVVKNNNVIMLGKPKKAKEGKSPISKKSVTVEDAERNLSAKNITDVPNDSEPHNVNTEVSFDKQTNSLAVQVGSTEAESIDNDTSATYVPEKTTQPSEMDLSVRIDTPSSDFDF